MKIETDVWTVIEGKLKEVKFDEEIFTVEKKKQETKQATLDHFGMFMTTKPVDQVTKMKKEEKPKLEGKDIGKRIGSYGTNTINLNVFNDVKKWIEQGLSRSEIGANIKHIYKPHTKLASCNALASFYYIEGIKPKARRCKKRGKKVGSMKGNTIYENPYNEIKNAMIKNMQWSKMRDTIMKKYYPNYTLYSLNSMTSTYKRFAKSKKRI